ncbi:PREDICTED: thioredoxin domain-containing protein 15 isoform X2 [Polistes canadensis]|uniref:thioredoxin domain-containing protein 15 isoform X2 n=1 Tax=Polistes canadensis TaxID=91411 RepID=UPI000718E89A|nr:PREDICTED: thioredoxin domain-containing protein 15 isoform X2 [Polistes canadensis]
MYIFGKSLSLFMLVLASIISVLGQTDECAVETKSEDNLSDEDAEKMYITKDNDLVNATRLMELLILEPGPSNRTRNDQNGRQQPGTCVLVLFYARWCVFSSQAAPHFNALARLFPHIKCVAIDAIRHQSFNAQYGIVGVPTLMLVHNGKPIAKFNGTVYKLELFARLIMHFTVFYPISFLLVTSADFSGPVPSTPSNETDYCLVLSWIFIAACALYFTSKSRWWQQFIELVQNTWRESNAQHEHVD